MINISYCSTPYYSRTCDYLKINLLVFISEIDVLRFVLSEL